MLVDKLVAKPSPEISISILPQPTLLQVGLFRALFY